MNTVNNQIQLTSDNKIRHLLGLEGLDKSHLMHILDTANTFIKHGRLQNTNTLKGLSIANLFFEPSTRTRNTFELAAHRCGAIVINVDLANSATKKNETLFDTMDTLEAMQIDMFVLRHQLNGLPHKIAENSQHSTVINAGDGTNAHPTQALLDIMTIINHKPNIDELSIAIVGDILHSRVAHSDIHALLTLGVKDIRLVSPNALASLEYSSEFVQCFSDMNHGIEGCDVIIMLRIQKERMLESDLPNEADYFCQYGLTSDRLSLAKPDAIVMHPGPINREVEIASEVVDSKQSVVLEQVTNGIAIRMATLSILAQNF